MSLRSVATDTEIGAIKTSHLFITGSTGFIGRHVVAGAISRGWQVTVLGRRPSTCSSAAFVPWDLASTPEKEELADATCLVHLAADTRTEREAMHEDAEVDAARALIVALPPAARRPGLGASSFHRRRRHLRRRFLRRRRSPRS